MRPYTKSNEWTGKKSFNGKCLHDLDDANGGNPYEAGRCKSCRVVEIESNPRFNAPNRSMKTPVSSAGFNWELETAP